jgi:hypothetical protein
MVLLMPAEYIPTVPRVEAGMEDMPAADSMGGTTELIAGNIQHSTSNIQHPKNLDATRTGCSKGRFKFEHCGWQGAPRTQ